MPRDPLKMTIVYLRLWKFCDVVIQASEKQPSSKFFEIVDIGERVLEKELVSFVASKVEWADNPGQLLDEIRDTLDLGLKTDKTSEDYAVLGSYRELFQQKALAYSGELEMVSGQGA